MDQAEYILTNLRHLTTAGTETVALLEACQQLSEIRASVLAEENSQFEEAEAKRIYAEEQAQRLELEIEHERVMRQVAEERFKQLLASGAGGGQNVHAATKMDFAELMFALNHPDAFHSAKVDVRVEDLIAVIEEKLKEQGNNSQTAQALNHFATQREQIMQKMAELQLELEAEKRKRQQCEEALRNRSLSVELLGVQEPEMQKKLTAYRQRTLQNYFVCKHFRKLHQIFGEWKFKTQSALSRKDVEERCKKFEEELKFARRIVLPQPFSNSNNNNNEMSFLNTMSPPTLRSNGGGGQMQGRGANLAAWLASIPGAERLLQQGDPGLEEQVQQLSNLLNIASEGLLEKAKELEEERQIQTDLRSKLKKLSDIIYVLELENEVAIEQLNAVGAMELLLPEAQQGPNESFAAVRQKLFKRSNPYEIFKKFEDQKDMSEAVDGMMKDLKRRFYLEHMDFPFVKCGPQVYMYRHKKLFFSVHSGTLVVRYGAGYEDFFNFLEREWQKRSSLGLQGL